MLVHDMCFEISVQIGRFVQGVGKLEEEEVEPATTSVSRVASVRQSAGQIRAAASPKQQKVAKQKNTRGSSSRCKETLLASDDEEEEPDEQEFESS